MDSSSRLARLATRRKSSVIKRFGALGGYSILQAESKDALVEALGGHPHFLTPEGSIEIIEVMPIPGM